jgi:hypothetical protein
VPARQHLQSSGPACAFERTANVVRAFFRFEPVPFCPINPSASQPPCVWDESATWPNCLKRIQRTGLAGEPGGLDDSNILKRLSQLPCSILDGVPRPIECGRGASRRRALFNKGKEKTLLFGRPAAASDAFHTVASELHVASIGAGTFPDSCRCSCVTSC